MLLGRKAMTNLDNILKSRDITLPIKVCLVKAMVFPIFMYGCESWAIKKAECWIIGAFELWCWRRLLRVPRTARRSNQPILKEISPEYSLEGLMPKLILQSFGYLMRRSDSWKDPNAVPRTASINSCSAAMIYVFFNNFVNMYSGLPLYLISEVTYDNAIFHAYCLFIFLLWWRVSLSLTIFYNQKYSICIAI